MAPAVSRGPRLARATNETVPPQTMNQKELKELIEFLIEKDIAEFELERGDVKVRIKRAAEHSSDARDSRYFVTTSAPPAAPDTGVAPAAASTPAPPAAPPPAAPAAEEPLHMV